MKNISIPKGMRGFILPLSFLGKLRLCTWQILFLLFFISLQAQAQQSDLLTLNMKNVTLKHGTRQSRDVRLCCNAYFLFPSIRH